MLLLLLTGLILLFAFREKLLLYALGKVQAKLKNNYGLTLEVQEAYLDGMSTVLLKEVSLVPPGNPDTILSIRQLSTTVRLLPLLSGKISLADLALEQAHFNIVRRDSTTNLDAFLHRKSAREEVTAGEKKDKDLGKGLRGILQQVSGVVPEEVLLKEISFSLFNNGNGFTVLVPETRLQNQELSSSFSIVEDSLTQHGAIQGYFDDDNWEASFRLYGQDTTRLRFPYVLQHYGLYTGFDTLRLELRGFDTKNGALELKGMAAADSMIVWHKRLSTKDIIFPRLALDFSLQVGSDFVALDSSSLVTVNKISLHPYVRYQRRPETEFTIKAHSGEWQAADFFASLPAGMFEHVSGLEAEGTLQYSLDFNLKDKDPWNCIFDSELKQKDFRILKYGEANLTKLNGSFVYTPYEYGKPMRGITVGASNPNFVPLDQVSPFLKASVLSAEDPSFFHHRGFIEEAFRQSIARNYVTRRFARGGSTISMQLVKNVFLSREKTISRKAEEALLVWLIEKNRLCSKERMFEVYLNIIEFGPNVYGIGEAANFYFGKHPSQLTLAESIWLSSIIPRPKGFKYTFNEDGTLKEYLGRYYRSMAERMVRREMIQPGDTFNLKPAVTLTGAARRMVLPEDSVAFPELYLDEIPLMLD